MIPTITMMWTCRWSARRIHRYLDADSAAPLTAHEVERLRAHLAVCVRCAAAAEDFRRIRRALRGWGQQRTPDPATITRVRERTRQLLAEDTR